MSDLRVFVDFGSTFTKMVVFDLDGMELVARVQVPSTVDRDITIGLTEAFAAAGRDVPLGVAQRRRALACSSAAGGLKVVCVGLVPELTTEAGRRAALGAGAKITGSYSYELSAAEVAAIEDSAPDIVLLSGGTDGGNRKVIVHNAGMLASSRVENIIVAGNKSAYDDLRAVFAGAGKNVLYTRNVLPEIGVLDAGPANQVIRDLFINRITEAKGIARARAMIAGVVLPTPAAVLEAARLLADGDGSGGLGELLLVDVGGATTDVYSVARGAPQTTGVTLAGLPEPYVKRTVEGDLGLVHNLETLLAAGEARGPQAAVKRFGVKEGEDLGETAQAMARAGGIPTCAAETECQLLLSRLAVQTAVERHVGRIETRWFPGGEMRVQRGKDLTGVKLVVGSGGPVAFSRDPRRVLTGALYREDVPDLLKPRAPALMLDRHYILFAVGLLSKSEPARALQLGRKYLVRL